MHERGKSGRASYSRLVRVGTSLDSWAPRDRSNPNPHGRSVVIVITDGVAGLRARRRAVEMITPGARYSTTVSPIQPMRHLLALTVLALSIGSASASPGQSPYRMAPSGRGTTEVTLTLIDSVARAAAQPSKIKIDYGQPALRGRKLFTDSLVPYDKTWRTGANGASMLTTDVDLIVGGKSVPKGTYVLQSLPSRTGWKLLIQKDVGQSPEAVAMTNKGENDIARIDMRVSEMASPTESLTMWLIPSNQPGTPHGELRIGWGTLSLSTDWSLR